MNARQAGITTADLRLRTIGHLAPGNKIAVPAGEQWKPTAAGTPDTTDPGPAIIWVVADREPDGTVWVVSTEQPDLQFTDDHTINVWRVEKD